MGVLFAPKIAKNHHPRLQWIIISLRFLWNLLQTSPRSLAAMQGKTDWTADCLFVVYGRIYNVRDFIWSNWHGWKDFLIS